MLTKKSFYLIALSVFYVASAYGQTYKCRNSNGQIAYSDSHCIAGSKIEKIMAVSASSPVIAPTPDNESPASNDSSIHQRNLRYLDMKIDDAINAGDFGRAKQWAITPEHWKKIKGAEEDSMVQAGHTVTTTHDETSSQQKEVQWQPPQMRQVIQQRSQPKQQYPMDTQDRSQTIQQQHVQGQQQLMQERQQKIMQAQQQQRQEAQRHQQEQQNQQRLQQQEAQRLKQELERQIPAVTQAMKNAGTSAASVRNSMIQNQINQLNQTAKHGVSIGSIHQGGVSK